MASMRDIKRRKGSIQSTQQITKAMKLVSTVKLQRAKATAERSKNYFHAMYDTVHSILRKSGNLEHKYLKSGETGKKGVIVITSNRGLAGGYNSNVIKLITQGALADEDLAGLPDEYARFCTPVVIRHSHDVDSLNLPMAAGIALYEFTKAAWNPADA